MSQTSSKHCITLRIGGMTCASCELLLERKIKAMPGVQSVDINHRTAIASITTKTEKLPSKKDITTVIETAGYSVIANNADASVSVMSPDKRKWIEIGGSLLLIFALYKILQTFDLVSLAPSTNGILSIGGIFVIGLVAGTSSCLAVSGGLLLALAAKHNAIHRAETPAEKFKPLLQFNIGRLISYFMLGGLVGVLGQSITLSTRMTGYMNIVVALVMLYLALSILGFIRKGSFPIRPPKKFAHWIAGLSDSNHPAAPFALGALTFFLPCGFTQSLQLAALASGTFATGALIMSVFALGTLPALLGISAISSTAKGTSLNVFLRFSGTLVLVLALFNLSNGLALSGFDLSRAFADNTEQTASAPVINNGAVQEVSLKVTPSGYVPSALTIKAGVPVRWTVDGSQAFGCTTIMTIPSMNITKSLGKGSNIIEFTATQPGPLPFMCSMGMVRGSFTVI
jgi:sulfite exporter TauE/SafE/copper chaperone CopZ